MIFDITTYTYVHVLLSFVGILSGFIVLYGLLTANRMENWTLVFLATTLATSLTGFGFPFRGFTPAIGVGIISTVVLLAAILARYAFRLEGPWRAVYVAGAVLALYLNVFVLVTQSFLKIPALTALAPGNPPAGPVFGVAQGIVLVFFVIMIIGAWRRFRPV